MGSGSTKQLGPIAGRWFNKRPIYNSDLDVVKHGIDTGRYVQVAGTNMPHGHEHWFALESETGPVHYARKMSSFKSWWFSHSDDLMKKAVAATRSSAEMVERVASVAVPVLLDGGKSAAKKIASGHFSASEHAEVNRIIDHFAGAIPEVAGTEATIYSSTSGDAAANRAATKGTPAFYSNVSEHAYRGSAEKVGVDFSGGYAGGCSCDRGGFVGSDELDLTTVTDYADSANSKTKAQIIDDLIKTAERAGFKVSGETTTEKVKSMLSILPVGRKIPDADGKQRALCSALAGAVNTIHGSQIIDPKSAPEVQCQQIAEVISSLGAGMHTEFLAVFADVKRVLKNLNVLKSALNDTHKQMLDKIKGSSDSLIVDQLATVNDLHAILTTEIERQTQLLSNLLNVTLLPSEKTLSKLIADKKDIHSYIDRIDVKAGTAAFGKVIGDILKGLGVTATFAQIIDDALKRVGMTVAEYNSTGSVQTLREKITAGLLGKSMGEDQLHEYLKAAELLYANFYRSDEIAKQITGRGEDIDGGSYGADYKWGGDDAYPKSAMQKRVDDRTKLRNLIFTTFYRQINGLFDNLVMSIDALTARVGTEIPLSDALNSFRQVLERVKNGFAINKNIYHALIGYYNDALSKSKRDELIGNLNMVSSYIDVLLEMPLYAQAKAHFAQTQGHIKSIVGLIDRFSDEMIAKFGRGESCENMEDNIAEDGQVTDAADPIHGGAIASVDDMLSEKVMYRSTKTIEGAVNQFDYKYRVAQIKANLTITGAELGAFGEKYDKLVAQSIAEILNRDAKTHERLVAELNEDRFGKASEYKLDNTEGFKSEDAVRGERDAALRFLNSQWETKKKFWATVEAVDTYMRVFTDALVRNPQDVKEIKSMIDSIEVISDLYSENTGETLASVFDHFPSFMTVGPGNATTGVDNNSVTYPPKEYREDATSDSKTHYYDRIAAQKLKGDPGFLPGNPNLVTIPSYGEKARNAAKKTLTGLAILKNLLSVFVHVGSKFGGTELRSKVFMTPTQMYNNLIDYLHNSAFAQGFGVGNMLASTDSLPNEFSTSKNMGVTINMDSGEVIDRTGLGQLMKTDGKTVADPWTDIPATSRASSHLIHLGVTLMADVNVVDAYYDQQSNIAELLTNKINASTGALGKGIKAKSFVDMGNGRYSQDKADVIALTKQTWASSLEAHQKIALFKKRWGVWMRSTIEGLKEQEGFSFKLEDEYFVLVMKSLAAKILTVVGMYDVLDRPLEFNGLSPIRMIIGGAEETPKIIPEAVPLYLRLPLLAQFYRGIFGFEDPEDAPNTFKSYDAFNSSRAEERHRKISMVPDIDGTFSGLVRLIFRKHRFIKGTIYADDDMRELIREVNLIYQRMSAKHSSDIVMGTIREFIAEINRRYGVVSKSDRNIYESEFGPSYEYSLMNAAEGNRYDAPPDELSAANIAILPGETNDEIVRQSGAQRLLGEKFDLTSKTTRSNLAVSDMHRDLVYRFRCAIDKHLENPDESFSFDGAIRAVQIKLKSEQNDEARFKLVSELVRGNDIHSKTDGAKYILFHETVVAGLNVLSAVHTMLARFKNRVHSIDIEHFERVLFGKNGFFDSKGPKTLKAAIKEMNESLVNMRLVNSTANTKLPPKEVQDRIDSLLGANGGGHEDRSIKQAHEKYATELGKYAAAKPQRIPLWAHADVNSGDTTQFQVVEWDGTSDIHANFIKTGKGLYFSLNANITSDPKATNGLPPQEYACLTSVLLGHSVHSLREAYHAPDNPKNKSAKEAIETFMRFTFCREWVMKELLESAFGLGHDFQNLVQVKLENDRVMINYSGLKDAVIDLFGQIHYFMDLLRPHIHPDVMVKYSDKRTPGSYYWLQEQIMEKIIVGRPAQVVRDGEGAIGYASLDECMMKLSYTYGRLTRNWKITGLGLTDAGICEVKSGNDRASYAKTFAAMIFYDASKHQSGLLGSRSSPNANEGVIIADYMKNPYDGIHLCGQAGSKVLDTRYIARFGQLYSWDEEYTNNRSALFAFNQLVAKYIQAFYDPVSSKIYSSTLTQFATGAFSRAITDQLFTYPDTVPGRFINVKAPGTVSIANSAPIESAIGVSYQKHLAPLRKLFGLLFEYGSTPSLDNGASVLADTAELIMVNTTATTAIKVPATYVYLAIYFAALIVVDILNSWKDIDDGDNAAAIQGNAVNKGLGADLFTMVNLGQIDADLAVRKNLGTMSDIRILYNISKGTTISFKQVIKNFLEGTQKTVIFRYHTLFNPNTGYDSSPNTKDLAQFQLNDPLAVKVKEPSVITKVYGTARRKAPMAVLLGTAEASDRASINIASDAVNKVGENAYAQDYVVYRDMFNVVLAKSPTLTIDKSAQIISAVRSSLPSDYVNNMGSTGGNTAADAKYRLDLFTAALLRVAELIDSAKNADDVDKAVKDVIGQIYGNKSVYDPNTIVNVAYSAKQDDLIMVSSDQFSKPEISGRQNDRNFIMIVHMEALKGLGQAGKEPHVDFSDRIGGLTNFGQRYDPDSDHVLFTSLAVIIKNLISSKNNAGTSPIYLHENVADVASYMKEKMRANMPAFKNLFNELSTRCEFIKRFAGSREMSLERPADPLITHNPWPYVLRKPTTTSDTTKDRFVGILDTIIRGCQALSKSCDQVLREIGDDPKYFETHQNSAKDYRTQYGMDPLMPLSSTLVVLKNTTDASDFMPIHALGEDKFKMMYGLRAIIGNPTAQPLPEHIVGFAQTVDNFNLSIDNKLQADKTRADGFLKSFVKLLRYVHELKHIKGVLTPHIYTGLGLITGAPAHRLAIDGLFTRDDLVVTDKQWETGADRNMAIETDNLREDGKVVITNRSEVSITTDVSKRKNISKIYGRPVFSIPKTLGETLKLTESSFKEDKIRELVEYIAERGPSSEKSLEVQNIIDLNVVPIDVHALMREIPLANLYNYAYTFDRLIIELYYGLKNEQARKHISELCDQDQVGTGRLKDIKSAKDALVALLLRPYMNLYDDPNTEPSSTYDRFVKPMLNGGANSGELGRPKFLSDQIFNKAIFGQMYSSRAEYRETGPARDVGVNWLGALKQFVYNFLEKSHFLASFDLETPQRRQLLGQIVDAVVERHHKTPNITLEVLSNDILKYYNEHDAKASNLIKFSSLNPADSQKIWLMPCIITMLSYHPFAMLAKNSSNRDSMAIAARVLTVQLSTVDAIGKNVAADAHWFGMKTAAVGNPSAANAGEAIEAATSMFTAATPPDDRSAIRGDIKFAALTNSDVTHFDSYIGSGGKLWFTKVIDVLNRVYGKDIVMAVPGNPGTSFTSKTIYDDVANLMRLSAPRSNLGKTPPIHDGQDNTSLHWIIDSKDGNIDTDDNQVKSVDVSEIKDLLAHIGRLRFDTVFIRNLVFITNLYRSVRMKLQRDLVYSKDIILHAEPITRANLTEFFGNQTSSFNRATSLAGTGRKYDW